MQIQNAYPQISFSSKQVDNIPWVQRYRPHQLNDLISHQSILTTLKTFIKDSNLPNLLFYGPPGTGKTSTILALAKQLYQKDFKSMVLELNASDQRGINVVRDQIKSFAGSGTLSRNQNVKLVILDQADMMTKTAQFALRRIIEKFHSNARFCLISNYVSKIIPALQSRCTRFKFKQITFQQANKRIVEISSNQNLKITSGAIQAVFKLCQGDMRRVVNMLQSLSMMNTEVQITEQRVYDFTGNPSPQLLHQILETLLTEDFDLCFSKINDQLRFLGISLQTIVRQLYQLVFPMTMPNEQKAFIVNRLGDIQYRLSLGCQQKISLASLIGAFVQIRNGR